MAYLEQTGMLAKLLATENLVVEHSHSITTASFDTESRVLTLPMFSTSSRYVSNLLVAHEVSHALNTPQDWPLLVPAGVSFDFVNVIEDVRIEKMIQSRYPGLRVDFSHGYDELNESDFFGINNVDISKMKLIDRINLHFKLGARAIIPFSDREMTYVRAIDEADTFDKVLLIAQMISDYVKQDNESKTESESQSDESGDSEQQTENSQANSNADDTDDNNDADDNQIDIESDNTAGTNTVEMNEDEKSDTQQHFDDKMAELLENNGLTSNIYLNLPDIKVDELVISTDTLRQSYHDSVPYQIKETYLEFMNSIKRDVNFMVQQFEMRKSADAYARQQVNKTGVLNTSLLHNYKLTDDLFLRQSVTPDGKSHGMVMYIDWSGSMANIAFSTIKQVLVLAQFCRKIGMPFEVYTMTTGITNVQATQHNEINMCDSYLVRVLTSTASRSDLDLDMLHLYSEGHSIHNFPSYTSMYMSMGGTPLNNTLAVTPQILRDFKRRTGSQKLSFVCLTDGESSPLHYVTKQQSSYKNEPYLLKEYGWHNRILIRDGFKVIDLKTHNGMTGRMMKWIASADDITVTNMFIGSERECSTFLVQQNLEGSKIDSFELRKTHSTSFQVNDKWLVCLLKPQAFANADDNFDVAGGATKAQIRTALKKHLKNKQTSRKLLTSLASQFS